MGKELGEWERARTEERSPGVGWEGGRRKRWEGGARDRWAAWPCRDGVTLWSACAALRGRRAAGCGGKAGKEATVATPGAAMGWREGPAWGGQQDGPQGLVTGCARVP